MKREKVKKWDLVQIKLSGDFLSKLFVNHELHINVKEGLDERPSWKVVGFMQDPNRLSYSVYLGYGDIPEGVMARQVYPTMTDISALCKL